MLSNDAFGQHYATSDLYNDQVDQCYLWQEAVKYYANIVSPYSKMVKPKVDQFLALNLPLEMICPSHGVIWRDNPLQIVNQYVKWAGGYREDEVLIVYDTMWLETRDMAEALGRGVTKAGMAVKVVNAAKTDETHVMTDAFRSAGILVGSPTVNNGISVAIASVLEGLKHLKLQGKQGAAFGSYGWSGEAPGIVQARLEEAGVKIAGGPFKQLHNPTQEELDKLEEFGQQFAEGLRI